MDLDQELIANLERGEFTINSTPPPTQQQLIPQTQNGSYESFNTSSASTSANSSSTSSPNNSTTSSPRISSAHSDPAMALRDVLGTVANDIVTRAQTKPIQAKQNSTPNIYRGKILTTIISL